MSPTHIPSEQVASPSGRAATSGGVRERSSPTFLLLDGLQDPLVAKQLSAAWASAGFTNQIDTTAQSAWLMIQPTSDDSLRLATPRQGRVLSSDDPPAPLFSATLDTGRRTLDNSLTTDHFPRAASIARRFALEPRFQTGSSFNPNTSLPDLRKQITYEYKSRFATSLMFGLPALVLHYAAPILAPASRSHPAAMFYPWLIELLLVAWACIAAGWPILYQGALALRHLRATSDLLTTLIVLFSFSPSALATLSLLWSSHPWFLSVPSNEVVSTGFAYHQPFFHAAWIAVTFAVFQRWMAHRYAPNLAGHAQLLLHPFSRFLALWLALCSLIALAAGLHLALAVALLLPPMTSLAAVNRWSPGWSFTLPIIAFLALLLLGPHALLLTITPYEIETASAFSFILSIVITFSWRSPPTK